jgi:hypothetical protein
MNVICWLVGRTQSTLIRIKINYRKKGDNHKHKTVQKMENKISDNIIHHCKKTIKCTVKSVLRGNLWDKENVSL